MIVKGQRVFIRGAAAVVLDAAGGQVTIELDGRTVVVAERELVPAESAERAEKRIEA